MRQFGHNDVEILEEKTAWSGFWKLKLFRLRHRRFAGGWSEALTRELHCRGEAVGVLLYDPTLDAIGMVEQFRIGAAFRAGSPWLLELVAGLVEEGETPAEVAVRETTEESGCVIQELLPVAGYFSSPGGTDEYFHLFCARASLAGVAELHGKPAEHEDIRLHVIPYARALEMQQEGRFDNAHTLIALQWLQVHREELRRAWT
jgi:ADP-ribose pyrophosphatase